MTQEELDALMANGLDDLEEEIYDEVKTTQEDKTDDFKDYKSYKADATKPWPPPPPTEDHKVVNQLDDVTRDSEVKANEMLEKIETIMEYFSQSESYVKAIKTGISKQIEVFTNLSASFPNVNTFQENLDSCNEQMTKIDELLDTLMMGQDEAMMAMDAMQYQDIHRQKIERVINVMRALSRYMNSLFEGRIDDEKRTSSAVHIEGDSTTDVVSNDDIEALIASLGVK